MVLRGVIECEEDGADSNNTVESTVQLTAPMLPYVTDIKGESRSTTSAHIAWKEPVKYPHAETVTDDVDSYKPFAITGIGDWTTVDRDLQITIWPTYSPSASSSPWVTRLYAPAYSMDVR